MNKCESYATRKYHDPRKRQTVEEGCCLGTREYERCHCGGDPSKCDFYESKRKEGQKNMESMNTATMWLKAQEDGKLYNASDLFYHRRLGFVDSAYTNWRRVDATQLMEIHDWKEVETKVPFMSKNEAEAKFNIKIIG